MATRTSEQQERLEEILWSPVTIEAYTQALTELTPEELTKEQVRVDLALHDYEGLVERRAQVIKEPASAMTSKYQATLDQWRRKKEAIQGLLAPRPSTP